MVHFLGVAIGERAMNNGHPQAHEFPGSKAHGASREDACDITPVSRLKRCPISC
jgi:hypothetical protein